jgi:hypothetical protein
LEESSLLLFIWEAYFFRIYSEKPFKKNNCCINAFHQSIKDDQSFVMKMISTSPTLSLFPKEIEK